MPRLARVVVPGLPHHVVQRGNRRQDVFFSDADREAYLALPKTQRSLALAFSDAHVRYTRMVNFRERWREHLWQERSGSSPMDARHTVAAVPYVERSPVRARLARVPWEYAWSSAAFHVGKKAADPLVSDEALSGNCSSGTSPAAFGAGEAILAH